MKQFKWFKRPVRGIEVWFHAEHRTGEFSNVITSGPHTRRFFRSVEEWNIWLSLKEPTTIVDVVHYNGKEAFRRSVDIEGGH